MSAFEAYQRQLWDLSRRVNYRTPISQETEQAYFATPRHLFVPRFREWGTAIWHHVTPDNLEQHLGALYADRPLVLFGEDDNDLQSTISQPSFVLRMLDLLQLHPGQTVFELGAGSGWNAALIGHLVGLEGRVVGLEIIPEVAAMAANTIGSLGIQNVSIVTADGGDGFQAAAPFDRAVFTAGTYDLPRPFYDQLKEDGLLLSVIKIEGGGDSLFLLRKTADHFESLHSMTCAFVQVRGKYQTAGFEPIVVEGLPEWSDWQRREVSRRRFWWGGRGPEWFAWGTLGIRFFLAISEPTFRAFKTPPRGDGAPAEAYFGLYDKTHASLVIAKDDWLVAYGNQVAMERLLDKVREWVELGMPTAASFRLRVLLRDERVPSAENQWTVTRQDSQFVWSLER
jgi:protein-L-isoaspartate(D-aspartate) O-methyltransferase